MLAQDRTPTITLQDAAAALRALPYGGIDDATRSLQLPAQIQATVSPVINAIRWAAVMFGMVFAATRASAGNLEVVACLAVLLFLTTWRTVRPIRLGSHRLIDRILVFTDAVIIGLAIGESGAFESPFIFGLLAAAAVAAFGWGLWTGLANLIVGGVATLVGAALNETAHFSAGSRSALAIQGAFLLAAASIGFGRDRLLENERRRASLAGRVDLLSETNDLLHILNQLARTLPMSLDLREAMSNARDQIRRAFDADVVALAVYDDLTSEWTPHITDGCSLRPSLTQSELPARLAEAAGEEAALLAHNLVDAQPGLHEASRSGIYSAIRARGQIIGVLGVEHRSPGRYTQRDLRIMEGLGDVLALTVDNARSFRRLRTLGAEEERSRIARDLHDRLGQWLSYISLELERIITTDPTANTELSHLHVDVQTAIDELRETLRQLRSGVTAERGLEALITDLVERFNRRGEAVATFTAANPGQRLPVKVENELLRILQEALSNISKHARAKNVVIDWAVEDGIGTLLVEDNGQGFDTDRSVRDSAYGLVGMRERADMVGARLTVDSTTGEGTTIRVTAGGGRDEPLVTGGGAVRKGGLVTT